MSKFFKTFLALMLCGMFCVGVCACGVKDNNDSSKDSPTIGDEIGNDIFD